MPITRRAMALGTLAAPALGLRRAQAQASFPTRPVRIIVPYTPGGVSDITARLMADPLAASEYLLSAIFRAAHSRAAFHGVGF